MNEGLNEKELISKAAKVIRKRRKDYSTAGFNDPKVRKKAMEIRNENRRSRQKLQPLDKD